MDSYVGLMLQHVQPVPTAGACTCIQQLLCCAIHVDRFGCAHAAGSHSVSKDSSLLRAAPAAPCCAAMAPPAAERFAVCTNL